MESINCSVCSKYGDSKFHMIYTPEYKMSGTIVYAKLICDECHMDLNKGQLFFPGKNPFIDSNIEKLVEMYKFLLEGIKE